jgi:OmcA/MtrC family decaheme c-type cytochrome
VDIANCQHCHGEFSKGFSIHGNQRNQTEYCVICHNPNGSDFARRSRTFCAVSCGANKIADTAAAGDDIQLIPQGSACTSTDSCVIAVGPNRLADSTAVGDDLQRTDVGFAAATPTNETIHLKGMIHRLHTGEALERKPFLVYGFGPAIGNFTPNDFGDILFPDDRRHCVACHVEGAQLLPLADGVLPTAVTEVQVNPDPSKLASTPFVETVVGSRPPVQAACLPCHDGADAQAHAETQTSPSGVEACNVCHEEGRIEAVSVVHATGP